jgi:hypothetical protein
LGLFSKLQLEFLKEPDLEQSASSSIHGSIRRGTKIGIEIFEMFLQKNVVELSSMLFVRAGLELGLIFKTA